MKNTGKRNKQYTECVVCGRTLDRYDYRSDAVFADDGLGYNGPRNLKCAAHAKKEN